MLQKEMFGVRRKRVQLLTVLIIGVIEAGLTLAYNAAANEQRWPGALEPVHRHPWLAICVFWVFAMLGGFLVRGNESKDEAGAAAQVTGSNIGTPAYVGGDFQQVAVTNRYEAPPVASPRARPLGLLLYLAAGAVIFISIPVFVIQPWSSRVPKTPHHSVRPGHSSSPHPSPAAPSTPVAASASTAPSASPAPEDPVIYQDRQVTFGPGGVNVDKYPPVSSPGDGVRVSEFAKGLSLDSVGVAQGMGLATYPSLSQPSEDACIQAISRSGRDYANASAGQYVCLRTAQHNIDVIRFTRVYPSGNYGTITAVETLYRG